MSTSTTRRQKWHYPQAAPPKILHLAGRSSRRRTSRSGRPSSCDSRRDRRENNTKLETLFDRERVFSSKVGESQGDGGGSVPVVLFENCDEGEMTWRGGSECGRPSSLEEDEKWRFQAEVLRAECNLLRMEKEIAVRKLDRSRVYLERTLRSAIEALISGRKKICEGKNMGSVLEVEIQNLVDKLKAFGKGSRAKESSGLRTCSNFDRQVTALQRRLDKLGSLSEEKRVEKIRRMAEASLSMSTSLRFDDVEVEGEGFAGDDDSVEILKRKMEGLSNGILLERMEQEYDSIVSTTDSSAASTSKRVECLGHYVPFIRQANQDVSSRKVNGTKCSGQCKAVVRRIMEQVRAETEQWSQMQEMLGRVRDEMEELQASRDFWEDRALGSDTQIQSLYSTVQEWRERALSSEAKVTELQLKVSTLRDEIDSLKKGLSADSTRAKYTLRNESEKRVLICSLKENHHQVGLDKGFPGVDRRRKVHSRRDQDLKRSPLRDIGNSSRQNAKSIFPLELTLEF